MPRVHGQPPRVADIENVKGLKDNIPLLIASVNGGMNSTINPANLENNVFSVAKNIRFRYDYARTRGGYQKFKSADDPLVSDEIRAIVAVPDGSRIALCYFTETTSYLWRPDVGWFNLTGTWYTPENESFFHTTFIDPASEKFYAIMANGTDIPFYLDEGEWKQLGNAPPGRYVLGFEDRVLIASLGDSAEGKATIAWCADRDFLEYDILEDETAGSGILRVAHTRTRDDISGLFALGNVAIVLRNHSIWQGTPTRIATSPFSFYEAVPNIGCDMPESAAITPLGLIFACRHNRDIFLYVPGKPPQPIGLPVKKEIFASYNILTDKVFSTYDYQDGKYILGIKPASGSTKLWIFYTETGVWSYDELSGARCAAGDVRVYDTGGLAISELVPPDWADPDGEIQQLVGRIIDLREAGEPAPAPTLYIGTSDGWVLEEKYPEVDAENTSIQDFVNGVQTNYTRQLISKEYRVPRDQFMWNEIRLIYTSKVAGSFSLYTSKDGGANWTLAKTFTFDASDVKQEFQYSKLIRGRRLMWKVESTDTILTFHEYEILIYTGGQSFPALAAAG